MPGPRLGLEITISDAPLMGVASPRETSEGKQGEECTAPCPSAQWADLNPGHQTGNELQGEGSSPSYTNQFCPDLSQPS